MQGAIGCEQQDFRHPGGSAGTRQHGRDADMHRDLALAFQLHLKSRTERLDGRAQLCCDSGCTPRASRGKNDGDGLDAVAGSEIRYPQNAKNGGSSFGKTAVSFQMFPPVMELSEVIKVKQQ